MIALRKLEKPVVRKALRGPFVIFREIQRRRENEEKRIFNICEQIVFLKEEKNLEIQDEEYAKKILFKTGYFPLINGYKEAYKNP